MPPEINSLRSDWIHEVVWTDSTASTNQLAIDYLKQRSPTGVSLFVTGHQTAGRGRLGRSWFSDQGGLACTFVCQTKEIFPVTGLDSRLALVAGMGAAEAIEMCIAPKRALLKWPNDVYIAGRKAAGILVESPSWAPEYAVIGIGINVATDLKDAAEETRNRATSLSEVAQRTIDRWQVLSCLAERLREQFELWQTNPQNLSSRYQERCLLTGNALKVRQGKETVEGICRGLSNDGKLVLESSTGTRHEIMSGEIEWQ